MLDYFDFHGLSQLSSFFRGGGRGGMAWVFMEQEQREQKIKEWMD